MNKILTLEIGEQLLDRVHRRAVKENKSVPAWVAELLRRTLDEAEDYERDRRRALQHLDAGFHLGGRPLSERGSL